MEHRDHEVSHLNEFNRRELLKVSAAFTGLFFLNQINENSAHAAVSSVNLPGFSAFSKSVRVTKSAKFYLVESSGMPNHSMMVGIKSWQQQVPTIQPYSGSNAWSIPIKPTLSKTPMTTNGNFLRGAIALAVNGVPIFNALNNRGEDSFLIGELDDWGGHCGRADDYHYHIAPLHLQTIVGKKAPIAYALDGFPIYGETEVDGKTVIGLDSFNGHFDSKKNYHYHGTKTFPYINGGFKGVVTEVGGQVDPQALTRPFRPAGNPLRGAVITTFSQTGENSYDLSYSLNSAEYHVKYKATLSQADLEFVAPDGTIHQESYARK